MQVREGQLSREKCHSRHRELSWLGGYDLVVREGCRAVLASMVSFVDKVAFELYLDQLVGCRVRGILCGNGVIWANCGS